MPRPKGPNRKRVQVTLSDESWALIDQVSELTGQAKAALIAELVDTAAPALMTMVDAFKVLKDQPREAQRLLANFTSEAIRNVSQVQLDLDVAIDARTVKGKRVRRKGANGPT